VVAVRVPSGRVVICFCEKLAAEARDSSIIQGKGGYLMLGATTKKRQSRRDCRP
jgi:hypothetical protein